METTKQTNTASTGLNTVDIATLNAKIEELREGNLVKEIFTREELNYLCDQNYDSLYKALDKNQENTQYLWHYLVQYVIELNTNNLPELWKVKEFSWYGDDLSPNEAAIEFEQAGWQSIDEEDEEDIVDSIYDSYTNGSFTQAREEIAEALEAGIELIEEAYRLTDPVVHNDLLKFIAIEAAKYLANRPTLEARQNVLKW